jgi:hypothetical protein
VNDQRTNRNRQESLAALISRIPTSAPAGARSLLVQTTTETSYPTTAGVFYAVFAVDVTGDETEGATPEFAVNGDLFHVLNLGSSPPPPQTNLLAEAAGGIWIFRYDG